MANTPDPPTRHESRVTSHGRYIVQHTNIVFKEKLYGHGDEVEFPDDVAERLKDYLEPVTNKTEAKVKAEKSQAKTEDAQPQPQPEPALRR